MIISQKLHENSQKYLNKLRLCDKHGVTPKVVGGMSKMIDTAKLKGLIVEKGYTQGDIAKEIGITPKTFYERMKKCCQMMCAAS